MIKVSVPSRGLSYLNVNKAVLNALGGKNVSVPSRGLSYLNVVQESSFINRWNVSVPSRGLSYLNILQATAVVQVPANVSVPSRGLSYLNTIRQFSLPKRLLPLVCVANDILMIKEFNVFI